MTREEQIEVATATYIDGRLKNNVPPEEIEEIRLAYQAGAISNNLWVDAQGDDLPEIDREVIVLCDDGHGGYKVCFGHRPYKKGYLGKSLVTGNIETFYPKIYDKGGWNIPDVRWWLDLDLPNFGEEQQ